MTINLETEIVATRFDTANNICTYTIQRGSRRWTVPVQMAALDLYKGNKTARRNHLANMLEIAVSQRDPDPQPQQEAPVANPPASPQVVPW